MIILDFENKEQALYIQLYTQLKKQIHKGDMKSGEKLMSKRKMAEHLGVSINTVEAAYGQLLSEGFILSRPKSGYYVSDIDEFNFIENIALMSSNNIDNMKAKPIVDFATDGVDRHSFPYNIWRRLMKNCFNEYNADILKGYSSKGSYLLREAIRKHIYISRGVNCKNEQIIIGAGMDNLLNIISSLLGGKYELVMEEPVYNEAYSTFTLLGHDIRNVSVDEKGIKVSDIPDEKNIAVYITPSHQFPLGITMSAGRRIQLLNWTYKNDSRFIIEDDYDSEFRYNSKPMPSVQSIDSMERVIYLGTFSKTVAPSIRISYLVLPEILLEKYEKTKGHFSSPASAFEQRVLTEFISQGHYERHLNRMRKLYGVKRNVLLEELKKMEGIALNGENAGHYMAVKRKGTMSETEMVESALDKGIKVYPISKYFVKTVPEKYKSTVLIGYAELSFDEIRNGIALLKTAWEL